MTVLATTPTTAATDVADYFIYLANQTGSFINNSKLQKLVYYAQAWHLALFDTPLFEEDFEAWIHGPVIPSLFERYKKFGWKPILKEVAPLDLPQKLHNFLEQIAREYLVCDNFDLELMVRGEEPWMKARKGVPLEEPSHAIISKKSMKEYYRKRAQEENSTEIRSQAYLVI